MRTKILKYFGMVVVLIIMVNDGKNGLFNC